MMGELGRDVKRIDLLKRFYLMYLGHVAMSSFLSSLQAPPTLGRGLREVWAWFVDLAPMLMLGAVLFVPALILLVVLTAICVPLVVGTLLGTAAIALAAGIAAQPKWIAISSAAVAIAWMVLRS